MQSQTSHEYLTGAEVVRLLRIENRNPRQTLLRLRRAGLPAVHVLSRFLYPRTAVEEYIASKLNRVG